MSTGADIVVLGSLNIDYVFDVAQLPTPGQTSMGLGFRREFGGKGANQAVAAARLGACVKFLGAIGDDADGQTALASMREDGVNTSAVRVVTGATTGAAGIFVAADGANAIAVTPGANATLTPAHVAEWADTIADAATLLLQQEIPLAASQAAADIAHRAGGCVVLDPAPCSAPLAPEFASLVDWLTPNETEAAVLSGIPVRSVTEAATVARALGEQVAGQVLVTCGENGVVLGGEEPRHFAQAPVTVRDTVAAGDTFNGAFAVALTAGRSVSAAVAFAQRAAVYSVGREGAQRSMPRAMDLD